MKHRLLGAFFVSFERLMMRFQCFQQRRRCLHSATPSQRLSQYILYTVPQDCSIFKSDRTTCRPMFFVYRLWQMSDKIAAALLAFWRFIYIFIRQTGSTK